MVARAIAVAWRRSLRASRAIEDEGSAGRVVCKLAVKGADSENTGGTELEALSAHSMPPHAEQEQMLWHYKCKSL